MTLDELEAAFFLARLPRKHSPHTLDAYRRDIASIRCHLPADVEQVTIPALRAAFAGISHKAPASISRCWSTWNQLLGFAVAEGVLPGNPMGGVGKPRPEKSRPKAITGDDSIPRLLTVARAGRPCRNPWPQRDYAVIVVLLFCGVRASELLALQVKSLDGPAGDRVLGVRGKGNKERTVPIEPEVDEIISDYLVSRAQRFGRYDSAAALFVDNDGRPLRRGALRYLTESLYREAGIRANVPKGAMVHALRHTFATSVARAGATGTELQRLLGHESLATTQRYVDATGREVRSAARGNGAYKTLRALEATA